MGIPYSALRVFSDQIRPRDPVSALCPQPEGLSSLAEQDSPQARIDAESSPTESKETEAGKQVQHRHLLAGSASGCPWIIAVLQEGRDRHGSDQRQGSRTGEESGGEFWKLWR